MMLYAVNGTCRDSIRIGSLEDDHICGYGSRFQFSDDEEVEKFDFDHSLLSQTVKNRNIFDWMTVDLIENSINLFVQRYNRKFRNLSLCFIYFSMGDDLYGWRLEWRVKHQPESENTL